MENPTSIGKKFRNIGNEDKSNKQIFASVKIYGRLNYYLIYENLFEYPQKNLKFHESLLRGRVFLHTKQHDTKLQKYFSVDARIQIITRNITQHNKHHKGIEVTVINPIVFHSSMTHNNF